MPCVPFSIFGGPDRTGCAEVRFPVHDGWDSRGDSVACVCDSVKECEFCNVSDHEKHTPQVYTKLNLTTVPNSILFKQVYVSKHDMLTT